MLYLKYLSDSFIAEDKLPILSEAPPYRSPWGITLIKGRKKAAPMAKKAYCRLPFPRQLQGERKSKSR